MLLCFWGTLGSILVVRVVRGTGLNFDRLWDCTWDHPDRGKCWANVSPGGLAVQIDLSLAGRP